MYRAKKRVSLHLCSLAIRESREWGRESLYHRNLLGRVNKSSLLSTTSTLSTQLDKLLLPWQTLSGEGATTFARLCFRLAFSPSSPVAIDGCLAENFRIYSLISCNFITSAAENLSRERRQNLFATLVHIYLHLIVSVRFWKIENRREVFL